jgi:hypothetical protein
VRTTKLPEGEWPVSGEDIVDAELVETPSLPLTQEEFQTRLSNRPPGRYDDPMTWLKWAGLVFALLFIAMTLWFTVDALSSPQEIVIVPAPTPTIHHPPVTALPLFKVCQNLAAQHGLQQSQIYTCTEP